MADRTDEDADRGGESRPVRTARNDARRSGIPLAKAIQGTSFISGIEGGLAIDSALSRGLLAHSVSSGLTARVAELAEMQFNILRHRDSIDRAASELSDSMRVLSAGPLQIARAAETALNDPIVLKNSIASSLLGIRAARFDVIERITASILPLINLPPLKLPEGWDPPNWRSVPDIDFEEAIALVNEGVPLVWVPRASIVHELLQARDVAARDEILVSSRAEIAEDCMDVLADITSPHLKDLADHAARAVGALRNGYGSPAQALAANIFDTALREVASRGVLFPPPSHDGAFYSHVRSQIGPVTGDVGISQFQAACVLAPAITALRTSWPSLDPSPARFGRHPTSHRVGMAQYTDANAIIAVMLAVSVLREAQESGW